MQSHKAIIRVSFNEEQQNESTYFFHRIIQKIVMDNLELTPHMKGIFLIESLKLLEIEEE